jgi:hypothetical protein
MALTNPVTISSLYENTNTSRNTTPNTARSTLRVTVTA